MTIQTSDSLFETLREFSPISLEQLNSSASFLDRINTKYLIHTSQLADVIQHLKQDFYVLNIKEKAVFSYDNIYMDTKDYLFYKQHASGQSPRVKVRTRHYVDADELAFFEFKQKEGTVQRKFRYECGLAEHGKMTVDSMKYIEGIWQSLYNESCKAMIFPSL